MINAHAMIINPEATPQDIQDELELQLTTSGVINAEVKLLSIDVGGAKFLVTAPPTPTNRTKFIELFGTLNTVSGNNQDLPVVRNLRGRGVDIKGKEGRFARENPPPRGAK